VDVVRDDVDVAPSQLLRQPLERVVGPRTAGALAALGVHTVGDLLRHYPRRYTSPGAMTDLRELRLGEHVTVMAQVRSATVRRMRSRGGAVLEAIVTDGVRELSLTFFAKQEGRLRHHENKLRAGRVGLFTGSVGRYRGTAQLVHPDYTIVGVDADDEAAAMIEASRPIPIYPASAQIPSWRIAPAVRTVLDPLTPADVADPIPADVLARRRLQDLHTALKKVHEPFKEADWRDAQERLRYEEAFVLQAALARRRAEVAEQDAVARPGSRPGSPSLLAAFDAGLPFTLTDGQLHVGEQIADDLARPRPMQRLLQGEVGSGKTVVAVRAMLQVVDSGGQAALLAPTEVLAAQHLRTLRDLLGPLAEEGMLGGAEGATRVVLLTGSQTASARKAALLDIASGRAGIVVGTHALLGDKVQFADLGLVVVDEQHRFGVEQRDELRTRGGTTPHLLVMTATPIPRTVAMTVFGDLEISTMVEVPCGRAGVVTHVVPADKPSWMARTWQRVREEVDAGHRVYVVCPRISPEDPEAGEAADDADLVDVTPGDGLLFGESNGQRRPLRAVLEVAAELAAMPALAGVRIGVMHGRLAAAEKDEAMARFAAGDLQVLVSTTVIEVGVDVSEATAMVVMDADRFGLSQLHQLRGRVGRGSAPGVCLLVSSAPDGTDAATRVDTLAKTTDGLRIAQVDLELRREGDVLGAAQSGAGSSLKLLRVLRDADVIADARTDAVRLVAEDPDLRRHPALAMAIDQWLDPQREEFLERA
jgi:ATP-dependent DNA helicase RecG